MVDDIVDYAEDKAYYFILALTIAVVVSKYPELAARNKNGGYKKYRKELGDTYWTDDTVKERVPLH